MRRARIFLKRFFLCAPKTAYLCRFALWLISSLAAAQTPVQPGSNEWAFTTGGGAHIAGGIREGDFWAVQLRWGRVLTAPRGPGLLRGSLEYAFEVVPAMVMRRSGILQGTLTIGGRSSATIEIPVGSQTIFGGGFNPFLLQYNFAGRSPSDHRFVPFLQAGGGMLFTTDDVPAGTAQFNFTPQGGVGFYWLRGGGPSVVLGVRYHHISNAGRVTPNPGHNSLYFYCGLAWWR